ACFDDSAHGYARRACPAAKNRDDAFVDQLLGSLLEDGIVGFAVLYDRLDAAAANSTLFIHLIDGHLRRPDQGQFAEGHFFALGMKDADVDGSRITRIGRASRGSQRRRTGTKLCQAEREQCQQGADAVARRSMAAETVSHCGAPPGALSLSCR